MATMKLAILPLIWVALAAGQDYTGPSVLSRKGGGGGGRGGGGGLTFRPHLSLNSSFETGSPLFRSVAFGQNQAAEPVYANIYGGDAVIGLTGGRVWRRTSLNLNYNGNFRQYTGNSSRDGSNQFLQFTVSRRLTKRISVSLGESTSSFSGGYSYFGNTGQQAFNDRRLGSATPETEILSGRVKSTATLVDVTFQKSARLSFNGGADRFSTHRGNGQAGASGNRVRGDAVYRITRNVNVGMDYALSTIDYTRIFGSSSIQTLRSSFGTRLGRTWDVSIQAGVSRIYTLGIRGVTIVPEVAAIIGQPFGFEIAETVTSIPDVGGRLIKTFRRSSLAINYARGSTPGNGAILTSKQQFFNSIFTYTAVKKWHFNAHSGFNENNAVGTTQLASGYKSRRAGGGATYQLRKILFLNMQVEYAKFSGVGLPIRANQRNQIRASVGLSFSPGDQPLALR